MQFFVFVSGSRLLSFAMKRAQGWASLIARLLYNARFITKRHCEERSGRGNLAHREGQ
jgi:hypothetical protein